MKTSLKEKYNLKSAPEWVGNLSDEDLLEHIVQDKLVIQSKQANKGVCYLYIEKLKTSNQQNANYFLRIWELNNAGVLQGASIGEMVLRENERVEFYRAKVIRNGAFIDKLSEMNIRVIDDEQSSQYGSINKMKKVHYVINDMRLGDIFVLEYSIISEFGSEDFLDKTYIRYIKTLPDSYWLYRSYLFEVLNERTENLALVERLNWNQEGRLVPQPTMTVPTGNQYRFERNNLVQEQHENRFYPYIELATESSWNQISSYLAKIYDQCLECSNLKEFPIYEALNLVDSEDIEDRIQRIIEYVQNQIIYLYDADSMHGHLPQAALKTLDFRSGDCKAKSVVLVNLLRCIGLQAEIILVNYNLDSFIPGSLPSPFVFNHAIVRLEHNGIEYFIDPTWSERFGVLKQRGQPFFEHYLPLFREASLVKRTCRFPAGFNVAEDIEIQLGEAKAVVTSRTIYQRDSADFMRANLKNLSPANVLEKEQNLLFMMLDYEEKDKIEEIIKDADFNVILDDHRANKLEVVFKATIAKPYRKADSHKVFRLYQFQNTDRILKHKHREALADSFVSFSHQCSMRVTSELFIDGRVSRPLKNLMIENDYFSFKSSRNAGFKKFEATFAFEPKTYRSIETKDLEMVKRDLAEINNSNFGIGLVFTSAVRVFFSKWYSWVFLILALRALIALSE
ncbi:MAG: DUF3857 domain-containing protein [Verrucomicrobiales bacterium]